MWCGFNNTDDGWPVNATVDSAGLWREAVDAWDKDVEVKIKEEK